MRTRFTLDGQVVADVADAEDAIRRLNTQTGVLADTEALARLLLRAESVASSRIEGLEIGGRWLLQAELAQRLGTQTNDMTAKEVLGNIDAMSWAVSTLTEASAVTVEFLCEIHRRLLASNRLAKYAGQLRTEQNWIGGSSYNPCSAAFVPPPPELVPKLLEDLCAFVNDNQLSAVTQAAIAHAQFEIIHPFADGNDRTGRGLVHVVLRQRGLAPRLLPPISLVLATRSNDYIAGLTATHHVGESNSRAAIAGINQWLGIFAAACVQACADADIFEQRIRELRGEWRTRCGKIRAGSAAALLLDILPAEPLITVSGAATLLHRTPQAVNEAVQRLVEAGVLKQITVGRRNRAFEAIGVINAFTDLERRLVSPAGDTRQSPPADPRLQGARGGSSSDILRYMSMPLSIRFAPDLLVRLRRRAQAIPGSSASGLAQRLIDEGLRMAEHPGVVFKDEPSGRRAALAYGPDVWEVIMFLREVDERGKAAVDAASEVLHLP